MRRTLLERIARGSYRRRKVVLVLWIGALATLAAAATLLGGELRNDFSLPGSESQDATDLLESGGLNGRGGTTGQIVFAAERGVEDDDVRAAMDGFFADVLTEVPEVEIVSPYSDEGQAQVAPDATVAFAEVQFGDIPWDDAKDLADGVVEVWASSELPPGLQVELGGELFFEETAPSSEAIGFLAAMVILLIAFGSVLAMGLPILTALFGIGCGIAVVMMAAHLIDIPEFGPAAVMLIAIGVGIDYALLIVTRFREELSAGQEPEGAVVRAMTTAGRAVLFAGSTVIVALAGLLLIGLSMTRSLAIATSAGVLMVMLASLTLLPALLGFAGHNIDKFSVHRRRHRAPQDFHQSAWYRWSRVVQRRPGPVALVALVMLLALAVPVFGMRMGFSDAGNRPDSDTSRRAYDLVSASFGPGYNGPLFLAVDLSGDEVADTAVLDRLSAALDADDGVAHALPPIANGDVGFIQVFPTSSPQDGTTVETVERLRKEVAPAAVAGVDADVLVGGAPAAAVDSARYQMDNLPLFIAVVLVLSFVLLLAVFRGVIVALQAVVMNMLSIGAAYGAIVAIFQWGWGADLLGVGEPGPIEAWAPMMLFAIVFGLSIDYEVFLLSRIKEEYERNLEPVGPGGETASAGRRSRRNSEAVANGLAKTARLITAAAAIMVAVTGAFVLSDERGVQIFGLGLAIAILVDASLVRTLLVPASMELLGDRNWWLPRWVARLLPQIDVDGSGAAGASVEDAQNTREPEPVG